MSELLPCPICGKKVYIGLYGGEPDYFWMVHGGMHYDECKCRLFMESCKFELEDESKVDYDEYAMKVRGGLVRRWNSRAERTCHDDNIGFSFVCSECGANVKDTYVGRSYVDEFGKRWYATSNGQAFNYCPNCGCKVVS